MTSNLKIETIDPAVYLCYGAKDARSHRLTFVGQADSPWVGQSVSLNALGTFPVSTAPAIGLYQPFPLDGGEWTISCPDDGEPVSFVGQLQSEFTAAPYPISFELGHYLRAFLGKRNPIGAPLINEEVTAEVQVVSAYTQKSLKDIDVQWFVGGEPASPKKTNDLGWSTFSHTFTADGEQSITAKVFNPYDDTWVEHSFPIKVYADSPWKQADLKVNGVPVTWRSFVPLRRGQANEVTVKVEPAIAKKLRLALINEEGLNIVSAPDGTVWQLPDPVSREFKWTLTSNEQKSGRVRLVIYSQEVAQPWEHNGRVLAGDLAEEVEVRIDGKPVASDVNFFVRDQAGVLTLEPKEGSSIAGLNVTLTRVILDGIGEDDLVSSPGFGEENRDHHRWVVTGSKTRGTFQLILTCEGVPGSMTLALNALLSDDLTDEAIAQIGGVDIPAEGLVFFRGIAQTLTLVPKLGSLFRRLPVMLQWVAGTALEAEDITCEPDFDAESLDYSWSITGPANKSGKFQLKLVCKKMLKPIQLPTCILLSTSLADEAYVKVDDEAVPENGNYFLRDKSRAVSLVLKNGSPLVGFPVTAKCDLISGIQPGNLRSEPDFGTGQSTYLWMITGTRNSGTFQLSFSSALTTKPIEVVVSRLISQSIEDEAELHLDGDGSNIFWRGKPRALTLHPKAGSPFAGAPVALRWVSGAGLVNTDIRWDQTAMSHVWNITGSEIKSGSFILDLIVDGSRIPLTLPTFTLLSERYADEVEIKLDGVEIAEAGGIFHRGVLHKLSLNPRFNSPFEYMPVSLKWGEGAALTQQDFICSPSFDAPGMKFVWDVKGSEKKSGKFSLKFKWVQLPEVMEVRALELK
jgi:hypothetical protein